MTPSVTPQDRDSGAVSHPAVTEKPFEINDVTVVTPVTGNERHTERYPYGHPLTGPLSLTYLFLRNRSDRRDSPDLKGFFCHGLSRSADLGVTDPEIPAAPAQAAWMTSNPAEMEERDMRAANDCACPPAGWETLENV